MRARVYVATTQTPESSSSRRPFSWHVQTSGSVQGGRGSLASISLLNFPFSCSKREEEEDDVLHCAGATVVVETGSYLVIWLSTESYYIC